jgi:hypothetical protein
MTTYNLMGGYIYFGGTCCHLLQGSRNGRSEVYHDVGSSRFNCIVGKYLLTLSHIVKDIVHMSFQLLLFVKLLYRTRQKNEEDANANFIVP